MLIAEATVCPDGSAFNPTNCKIYAGLPLPPSLGSYTADGFYSKKSTDPFVDGYQSENPSPQKKVKMSEPTILRTEEPVSQVHPGRTRSSTRKGQESPNQPAQRPLNWKAPPFFSKAHRQPDERPRRQSPRHASKPAWMSHRDTYRFARRRLADSDDADESRAM